MMAVLPLLCDGLYGVAGWVPVRHGDRLFVVFSIRITTKLMEASVDTSGTGMADVFRHHMKPVATDADLFQQIMLKTPFKMYKKSAKMTTTRWLLSNRRNYIVMHSGWFRGLVAATAIVCDVPDTIPTAVLDMRMGKTHMFSDLSVTTHCTNGPNIYENMDGGVELTHEQLQAMPAMKCKWWREAYRSGCAEYFSMYSNEDGVVGVVTSGRYQLPYMGDDGTMVRSYTYQQTLDTLAQM